MIKAEEIISLSKLSEKLTGDKFKIRKYKGEIYYPLHNTEHGEKVERIIKRLQEILNEELK